MAYFILSLCSLIILLYGYQKSRFIFRIGLIIAGLLLEMGYIEKI
jgi:hypothetical protein